MNALLNCFPEKMLISSMLFLCMTAGNLFSATPETSKAPQKQDASTPNKGLKNFLISAQEKEEVEKGKACQRKWGKGKGPSRRILPRSH